VHRAIESQQFSHQQKPQTVAPPPTTPQPQHGSGMAKTEDRPAVSSPASGYTSNPSSPATSGSQSAASAPTPSHSSPAQHSADTHNRPTQSQAERDNRSTSGENRSGQASDTGGNGDNDYNAKNPNT